MADAVDPRAYLAGAAAIISDYPVAVGEALADPKIGSRVLKDRPSLSAIRLACDRLFEPIEREWERRDARKSAIAGLLPRPPRTAEQQARINAQIVRCRQEIAAAALEGGRS